MDINLNHSHLGFRIIRYQIRIHVAFQEKLHNKRPVNLKLELVILTKNGNLLKSNTT